MTFLLPFARDDLGEVPDGRAHPLLLDSARYPVRRKPPRTAYMPRTPRCSLRLRRTAVCFSSACLAMQLECQGLQVKKVADPSSLLAATAHARRLEERRKGDTVRSPIKSRLEMRPQESATARSRSRAGERSDPAECPSGTPS